MAKQIDRYCQKQHNWAVQCQGTLELSAYQCVDVKDMEAEPHPAANAHAPVQ